MTVNLDQARQMFLEWPDAPAMSPYVWHREAASDPDAYRDAALSPTTHDIWLGEGYGGIPLGLMDREPYTFWRVTAQRSLGGSAPLILWRRERVGGFVDRYEIDVAELRRIVEEVARA